MGGCCRKCTLLANQWFTVVGAYADTKESYLIQVYASDGAEAKAEAYREADSVVIGLSVFPGRINALKDEAVITPLRGEEHLVTLTQVDVTEKRISIQARCPVCRADLRKPKALLCADLWLNFWQGHLTKDSEEVCSERNQEHLPSNLHVANAARIQCAECSYVIHTVSDNRG